MKVTKQKLKEALLDAVVEHDVEEINDDNYEEVIEKIATSMYEDLLRNF